MKEQITKLLSNCCKGYVSVSSEGTNRYICHMCNRSCDLFNDVKEQISVEAPENYPLVCMDCANHLIMDQRLLIKREEYERLKRLEENVKKTIGELTINPMFEGLGLIHAERVIKLLESLDK